MTLDNEMNNLDLIKLLRASTFVDEDGEDYQLEFQPALTLQEMEELAPRFPGGKIGLEIIEILSTTKGWNGYGPEAVYFDSIDEFGFTELLPHSLTLGADGFGNFWVLDIDENGNAGKVFFACHDPSVLVIHSQNVNEYLKHLLDFYQHPADCHLNNLYESGVSDLWQNDHFISSKSRFLAVNPHYHEFLLPFDGEDWSVADLRDGQNGAGFAWGKQGANSLIKRHPSDLIWVMKNRKKGFLNKLLRR